MFFNVFIGSPFQPVLRSLLHRNGIAIYRLVWPLCASVSAWKFAHRFASSFILTCGMLARVPPLFCSTYCAAPLCRLSSCCATVTFSHGARLRVYGRIADCLSQSRCVSIATRTAPNPLAQSATRGHEHRRPQSISRTYPERKVQRRSHYISTETPDSELTSGLRRMNSTSDEEPQYRVTRPKQ